jgi:hypothetical protein
MVSYCRITTRTAHVGSSNQQRQWSAIVELQLEQLIFEAQINKANGQLL